MHLDKDKQYRWNQGWANRIAHSDINPIIEELNSIEDSFGEITPEAILISAKNKNSALHAYFLWDNNIAGEKYRLHQARTLLSKIEVSVISDNEPKYIRVYETLKVNYAGNNKYKKFNSLTPVDLQLIKKVIISDMNRIKTKIANHFQSEKIIEHIDKAIEEIKKYSTETKSESPALSAVV